MLCKKQKFNVKIWIVDDQWIIALFSWKLIHIQYMPKRTIN